MNWSGGTGAEVIYALRNTSELPNSILNNLKLSGQTTRKTYQRTLPSDTSKDYYFIHRNTGTTQPLIIEYGFIDDTKANNQFLNNNYKELAEAVIKSILEYKNLPYTPPTATSYKTHTVQKDDTLYSIAKKYNTTVNNLKSLNNLTTNSINIGQQLKIPQTTNTYTVKKNDTLYKIATQNNTTVQKLKDLNNLTTNTLTIGQVLTLPSTEIITIPTTTSEYTVKKGDTLYSIAKANNTTVDKLKTQNNLTTNNLTIGQKLKIPQTTTIATPTTTVTYKVKPGDTLYSIAKAYNTTVNNLKSLNNLTTNNISIGQSILINN